MLHRHATDVVALVFGVIFAGITAVWLLHVTDVIDLEQAWLAGPVILIVAGAVGLGFALRPSRRSEAPLPAPIMVPSEPQPAVDVTDDTEIDWQDKPTNP